MSTCKAVALYSGGLDSTLAILTVLRQGIAVTAVTFLNHFGCDISDKSSCSKDPFSAAEKFGFEVKLCHLADKFIQIVKNPKFGHGKNMNPCMDCRILMLREAREFMDMTGAEFLITGEVIGQRPMSQRRDALDIIDREAGLKGLILRPLSAKLLKPTAMEEKGMVDRDMLYGFSGRSRKPQMALADEFGLTDYPAPAGGCLLTEPNYSFRLRELLDHDADPSLEDLALLRFGRHFRMSKGCKIIVGRNRTENDSMLSLDDGKSIRLRVEDYASPVVLVRGEATEEIIRIAASLCARYSDAKHLHAIDVRVNDGGRNFKLCVPPAGVNRIEQYKIELRKTVMSNG
ncbi:MAG: tRNA (5-methylaminomethyl-2-thiouridylate)-methyltransferase [Nitrospirae bacterium]|nr:tRNA (5-methylaminomethyl-2-thiouridylate)-methyltransferase [Nitrospirota bacterium]